METQTQTQTQTGRARERRARRLPRLLPHSPGCPRPRHRRVRARVPQRVSKLGLLNYGRRGGMVGKAHGTSELSVPRRLRVTGFTSRHRHRLLVWLSLALCAMAPGRLTPVKLWINPLAEGPEGA